MHNPFFVVGVQRSGTTVLRLMLNSHPRLGVPFESDFLKILPFAEAAGPLHLESNQRKVLTALADEPLTKKGELLTDPDAVLKHPISSFGELISAVCKEWVTARGKQRWGIKTPGYGAEIDTLNAHFPDALFIHIVRDGRDVALSHKDLSWGIKSLPRIADYWKLNTLLGRKMGRMLGDGRYLELRYEDLMQHSESQLKRVCDFLGEEYSPDMLEYHKSAQGELPQSSHQWHRSSLSKPDASKVFAWRRSMSLADRILFDEYAGDVLELFGYERVQRRHTLISKLKHTYYAAFEA